MSIDETSSLLIDVENKYSLIILGKSKIVELTVDEKDLVQNADGEIDCPVDVVLHKNGHTFADFNEWNAQEIQFIRKRRGKKTVLRSVSLDVNL